MCCTVTKLCCISLRAGVITLACIWLLMDLFLLAWASYLVYFMKESLVYYRCHGQYDPELDQEDRIVADVLLSGAVWMWLVGAVLSIVAVLLDIMLLAGAINARPKLLHGWAVGYPVLYGVSLLFYGLTIVGAFLYHYDDYGRYLFAGIIPHAGLLVFFWIIVRSYYLELYRQHGKVGPCNTAGKVYLTVHTDVVPAKGTISYADGMVMAPTAPPRYTIYA